MEAVELLVSLVSFHGNHVTASTTPSNLTSPPSYAHSSIPSLPSPPSLSPTLLPSLPFPPLPSLLPTLLPFPSQDSTVHQQTVVRRARLLSKKASQLVQLTSRPYPESTVYSQSLEKAASVMEAARGIISWLDR